MIKIAANLLISIFIFISLHQSTQAKLLSFTSGDYPPFSTGKSDQAQGPIHDIILATCTQMRKDCFFHFVPWNFALIMSQNNRVTGIYPMVKNASSENWLKFSKPIIKSEFGFFAKKKSTDLRSKHDLSGFYLATTGPGELMRQLVLLAKDIPDNTLYIDQNIANSFKRFNTIKNKGYAVLADKTMGEYLIKQLKLKDIVYTFKVNDIEYNIGFPKKNVKAATISQFNASLATVLGDHTFTQQVEKKYGVLLAGKK